MDRVADFEFGVQVIAQAEQYVAEIVTRRETDEDGLRRVKTYGYWTRKQSVWPDLAPIALYWTAFPTSSTSVERAFTRLRARDVDFRARMTLPHTERELKLRVNKPVVEAALRLALADLDRM